MAEVAANDDLDITGQTLSKEAQLNKLDDLWEQYLYWIDEYQKTRKQLSEALSSGFFSLAQANFKNTSGARYGLDHYDERMKAVHRVVMEPGDEPWVFEVVKDKKTTTASNEFTAAVHKTSDEQSKAETDAMEQISVDPLRWFGILVPQALRDTQTNFTQATEGPIPRLATITRRMRNLEFKISRRKKTIKKLK